GGSTTSDVGITSAADAPLTPGAATVSSGVEGATQTLSATFTDANLQAPTSDFSGTIAWGDGNITAFTSTDVSGSNGAFTVNGSHGDADEGTYTATVTVNDKGGSTTTETGTTTITDAPLTPGAVTLNGAVEGATATLSATFKDGNTSAPTSDFSGLIFWGD